MVWDGGSVMDPFEQAWNATPAAAPTQAPPIDPFEAAWQATPNPKPSVDQLLGTADNPYGTAGDAVRTAVGGLAHMIPFNIGDEIIAGGTSLVDALMGDAPLGQAYDQRLNEIRNYSQAFHDVSPFLSGTTDLASAISLPGVNKLVEGAQGPLAKVLASSATGGMLGAAYGYGGGEGTDNRVMSAATNALLGEAIGAGTQAVAEGLGATGRGLSQWSDDIKPLTPEEQAVADLGITKAQVKAAEKFRPSGPLDEPNLVQAIDEVQNNGSGVFSSNPAENGSSQILARNKTALTDSANRASTILTKADEKLTDAIIPDFPLAKQYIASHPAEAEALTAQLAKREAALNKFSNGTLKDLNLFKQSMYDIGYSGTTDSKVLDKLIGADLKNTVESGVKNTLGDASVAELQAANAQYGIHKTIEPALVSGKLGDAARELNAGPAPIFPKAGYAGVKGASLLALLTGHPLGALAGVGAHLGMKAAESDAGRNLISALASGLGSTSSFLGKATQASLPGLIESLPATKQAPVTALAKLPTPKAAVIPEGPVDVKALIKKQDPLTQAQIAIESNGDPKAVSSAGAQGLLQIMPDTAKDLGLKDPFNPKDNLEKGVAYRTQLVKRYKNVPLALAAYNYGMGNVDTALDKAKAAGRPQDIHGIWPYLPQETKDYIVRIDRKLTEILKG